MVDDRYLENARTMLGLLDRQLPGWTPQEIASLIAVALGLRIGETVFPADPRQMMLYSGVIIGAAAACAQRDMTRAEKLSCEGRA